MIIYKNIECISVCKRERMWIYIMWGNGEPYKFRGKRIRKPKCEESQEITPCKLIKGERERQR